MHELLFRVRRSLISQDVRLHHFPLGRLIIACDRTRKPAAELPDFVTTMRRPNATGIKPCVPTWTYLLTEAQTNNASLREPPSLIRAKPYTSPRLKAARGDNVEQLL